MKRLMFFFLLLLSFEGTAQSNYNELSIDSLEVIYDSLSNDEAFELMLPVVEAMLSKAEHRYGKEDSIYARSLYKMGFVYDYGSGDYVTAMDYYKAACSIQKKINPKSTDYARSLTGIADVYSYITGQYDKAEPLYLEIKAIYAEVLGTDNSNYAEILNNLASMYDRQQRYSEAEVMYLKALEIDKKTIGEDHEYYAISLSNLAVLYLKMGKYKVSEAMFLKSLSIKKKTLGQDHPSYGASLMAIAGLYETLERYTESETSYLEAKAILEASLGKDHHYYATCLNNLALLYKMTGHYTKAEPLYLEGMAITEKVFGKKSLDYATTLSNMALLYQKMENYEKAEGMYKESIALSKEIFQTENSDISTKRHNLAGLYLKMKRFDEAEKLYLQSIDIERTFFGESHPNYIASLNSICALYIEMKDYEKALKFVHQSIQNSAGLDINLNITKAWSDSLAQQEYHTPTKMFAAMERLFVILRNAPEHPLFEGQAKAKQIIVCDLMLQLLSKSRVAHTIEADKLRILSANHTWTNFSLEVLDRQKDAAYAFKFAEENKSVLLMDATRTEEAYAMGDLPDSLIQKEKVLLKEHSKLEALLLEKRSKTEKDSLLSVLNHTTRTIKNFQASIHEQFPKYALLKNQQEVVRAEDIQKTLPLNTALLEYVVSDSSVHTFYIDHHNVTWKRLSVPKQELKNRIKDLHRALSDYAMLTKKAKKSYQQYTTEAFWFYKNLVAPFVADKKGIEHLVIVSDGELGHLPFEAFLVEEAKHNGSQKSSEEISRYYSQLHYLIQDYSISYNYSATLYAENKKKANHKNNGQIFGMAANYSIALDSSKKDLRLPANIKIRAALNPLPEAKKEVLALSKHFAGFYGFDSTATENVFKEKAGEYAVIHLAMHGLLDQKSPILSSLAFTENGDPMENNFLQAYEISKMKLHADLVVLSACETGFGKFQKGNGIASLARSFMYAGANSLVVSLWQVNDYATSEIMTLFYENMSNGMNKSVALQQAKLSFINNSKGLLVHPAFWSPFIQIGNSDPIQIAKKGHNTLWYWLGALLILLSIGTFVGLKQRKK